MTPIEYELTAEDMMVFTRHVAESVPFYVHARRGAGVWGFIFGVVPGGFLAQAQDSTVSAVTALVVMLALGGLCGYLMWREYPAKCVHAAMSADPPDKSRMGYGPHRLSAGAEGIRIEARHIAMQMQWSAFVRFEETALHLFLYVSRIRAFVIPKRGLDPDVLGELSALCRQQLPSLEK